MPTSAADGYGECVNVPEDLLYTKDHEWVRIEGGNARVGITDYAQDALGDIVYVQLPMVGATIADGQSFGEIESTKSVNDVYAPFAATVLEVNTSLGNAPETLNKDPYGQGWICVLDASGVDTSSLMSAEEYRRLIGG